MTQGAVRVERQSDGIHFHRFTKAQEEGYASSLFHPKQYATAGVRLHFKTDSSMLGVKVLISAASSRSFFTHDVLVNGQLIGSLESREAE